MADLEPGASLDLEVEYTFDERLLLTLVAARDQQSRFQLEINGDVQEDPTNIGGAMYSDLLPRIPRMREQRAAASGPSVKWVEWQQLFEILALQFTNGGLWMKYRQLERRMVIAENRHELVRRLVVLLSTDRLPLSIANQYRLVLTLRALCAILQQVAFDDPATATSEVILQKWVRDQYESGLDFASNLQQELGEIPGRLLWPNYDNLLTKMFLQFKTTRQTQAHVFLNSLGKCGRPTTENLKLLRQTLSGGQHMAQRDKAAWALARLVSPGQPGEWKAKFSEVETSASAVLDRLIRGERDARVLISLLGCLYQCLAWQLAHKELSASTRTLAQKLPQQPFAAMATLSRYPDIRRAVTQRLEVLPQLLEIKTASSENKDRIRDYLLEVVNR